MKSFADILREEGMEEENKKFIRNLLNDGKDIETIAKYTELSKEKIEKMIEEMEH